MSSFDSDKSQEGSALEDALWTADGDGDSSVHPQVDPGFDNAEADEVLHDSFEGPTDVDPREPGEQEAPKKKSNMGFYAAVGGFVIAAVGLVGYKSGLLSGVSKKPIEPSAMAAMPDETPKKPDSLMMAAAPAAAASGDVLGSAGAQASGTEKPGSSFEAEADLLAERPATPATPLAPAPAASQTLEPAAVSAAPASSVVPAASAAAPAPAAPPKVVEVSAAPVTSEKSVVPTVATAPAAKPEPKAAEPKAVAAPESAPRKVVKVARVEKSERPAARAVSKPTKASKPVVVAKASKPSKSKRIEKDATPDSKEVLAGWKLRGTWPSQGPNQLAWIADEQGRLLTVAVGQRISGARVLSIGKRGEVVQTTAGQILP